MDVVLNWLWQGGVVAAASGVTLFALRRAGANARYTVCWAALVLVVALPALPPMPSTTPAAGALSQAHSDPMVSLPAAWWTSALVIGAAWAVWASIQLARFASAIAAIRRARARSRAFPAHLESVLPHWRRVRFEGRRATLVLSTSVTSAAVLGWGAPMIAVAPGLVRTLDPDDLDRVLIHEWAHVQRHDDLVNVFQIAFRVVAGWHPALWWIDRRLHVEREIACDEMTVAITGSPKSYAECLMKLSTLRGAARAMRTAPAVFTPSGLRARVVSLVSARRSIAPVWSRTLAAAIVLGLSVLSVAVGGLTLVEAAALAQPLVSAGTRPLGMASDTPLAIARAVAPETKTEPSARRARGASGTPRRSTTEQPSQPPQPEAELIAPPAPQALTAVDSSHAAETSSPPALKVLPDVVSVPGTPQAPPRVAAATPQTPWSAAAAGGVAIGKTSKAAGVATAGFFTRVARRVAGSF